MTTAAAELRTAAATLRALATAASADRYGRDTSTWTSHHVNERDARLYSPDRVRIIRGGSSGAHGRGVHPHLAPAHADYIAAMDPTAGLALTGLLDAAAELATNYPEMAHDHDRTACDDYACDVMGRAISLARILNGGQQ